MTSTSARDISLAAGFRLSLPLNQSLVVVYREGLRQKYFYTLRALLALNGGVVVCRRDVQPTGLLTSCTTTSAGTVGDTPARARYASTATAIVGST
jgi:hypothetical protein